MNPRHVVVRLGAFLAAFAAGFATLAVLIVTYPQASDVGLLAGAFIAAATAGTGWYVVADWLWRQVSDAVAVADQARDGVWDGEVADLDWVLTRVREGRR